MNRKNTILIAVMVNAGLLAVLFITALTTQEEVLISPSMQMADSGSAPVSEAIQDPKPLFGESADRTLRQAAIVETKSAVAKSPEIPAPVEVPVLHALPPLAVDEPSPPAEPLAAAPSTSLPAARPASASSTAAKSTPASATSGGPQSYYLDIIVEKGDTLDKLAKRHHTSVDLIIKINHLPSSFLRSGQQLKVPIEKTQAPPTKPKSNPVKEEGGAEYYTVKVGDNPWTIAMKHHMKVDELLRLNALNEEKARKLKPGDRLRTR